MFYYGAAYQKSKSAVFTFPGKGVTSAVVGNKTPFNGLFSRTTWVSRYQKGKANLDFTEARDSEWQ